MNRDCHFFHKQLDKQLCNIHNFTLFKIGEVSDGLNRDQFVDIIAIEILKKLPAAFEVQQMKKSFAMSLTPTLVVLVQEVERFNKLITIISKTLTVLRKALLGETGMSSDLEEVANALFNNQIPDMWRKFAPETTKTSANWIEFLRNVSFSFHACCCCKSHSFYFL